MFWYLATPYSKFPGGLYAAFQLASRETARLLLAGVPVFSPIAHTHPVAMAGGIDPLDHSIWLPADKPLMDAAYGLIMLRAPSWESSFGMEQERRHFRSLGRPVVYMDPSPAPLPLGAFVVGRLPEAPRAEYGAPAGGDHTRRRGVPLDGLPGCGTGFRVLPARGAE